jgi:hypothetical protein
MVSVTKGTGMANCVICGKEFDARGAKAFVCGEDCYRLYRLRAIKPRSLGDKLLRALATLLIVAGAWEMVDIGVQTGWTAASYLELPFRIGIFMIAVAVGIWVLDAIFVWSD